MNYPELFKPLQIKQLRLNNRIVVPPMLQLRPITSPEGIAWYRRLAAGGAGLVIVEGTGVDRFEVELTHDNLRPLADALHAEGAAAAVQLSPPKFPQGTGPDDLTAAQIQQMIQAFADAAAVCQEAGFDAVEPHGAHGFLLNQFFMPTRNHRNDGHGSALEGRFRMGVSIVQAIRQRVGSRMLLFYRHTPRREDYGLEESLEFARRLVDTGVDVLDISPAKDKLVADLAAPFRALGVPVIAVIGMNDPAAAAEALCSGQCDLVGVGRQLICDAQWPQKVQEGKAEQILACDQCNKGCYGALREHKAVACVSWEEDEVAGYLRPQKQLRPGLALESSESKIACFRTASPPGGTQGPTARNGPHKLQADAPSLPEGQSSFILLLRISAPPRRKVT